MKLILLIVVFSTSLSTTFAKPKAEQASKDAALAQTQKVLNDRQEIKKITESDPKAQAVDDSITELTGSEAGAKELYAISADILPVLMEMNQDDPDKALQSLTAYSKDPGAFLSKLPPDIRLKIENLAKKIEKEKVSKKP